MYLPDHRIRASLPQATLPGFRKIGACSGVFCNLGDYQFISPSEELPLLLVGCNPDDQPLHNMAKHPSNKAAS